jgi:Raf kinase inhibitor-like YbhB/YbcL family protein
MRTSVVVTAFLALAGGADPARGRTGAAMSLTIKSPAFNHQENIPTVHTCEGKDVAPALEWTAVPGAKSYALIVDDPDAPDPAAPRMTWVHEVLYDIPADVTSLPQGRHSGNLPAGAHEGLNDWKQPGYRGPCPPFGRHRYFFKLYALDTTIGVKHATKVALEKAMEGHILGHGELIGTYQKKH